MDPRIEFYKAAFSQKGNGFDVPVFRGTSRYQYGQGLGDVLCVIVRYLPKGNSISQTAGSEMHPNSFKSWQRSH